MSPHRPDLLVIVLDCGRAADFPGAVPATVRAPFLSSLLSESVRFDHATTVAPWTRPAHASLFTGLYPWEHGCHTKGDAALSPRFPTIAQELGAAGYRSISLSANPQIAPSSGLTRGFDFAAWGQWGERVRLRRAWDVPPGSSEDAGVAEGTFPPEPAPAGRWPAIRSIAQHRYAWMIDAARTVGLGVRGELDAPYADRLAPWIEPVLRHRLDAASKDQPLFCFINLLDAHEPYLAPVRESSPAGDRWRSLRTPQDHFGYLARSNRLSAAGCDFLHRRYRRQVELLDRRVEQIWSEWTSHRDPADCLLVVTSDHGQAFGEHGAVFHSVVPHESHLRIPLLVRYPHGRWAGSVASTPASLIDVHATLRSWAGLPPLPESDAWNLDPERVRPTPALAATDGLPPGFPFDGWMSPERRAELDRVYGVAYAGPWKVVVEAGGGRTTAFDVETDPLEVTDRWPEPRDRLVPLAARARSAAERMLGPDRTTGTVAQRLAGWGYFA